MTPRADRASAAAPIQGATSPSSGASAAAKRQAWRYKSRRTPLVAGGFLAGALLGALPPMQALSLQWNCLARGGDWIAEVQACEYRAPRPFVLPGHMRESEQNLLKEEER